jgi:hypothetical protein
VIGALAVGVFFSSLERWKLPAFWRERKSPDGVLVGARYQEEFNRALKKSGRRTAEFDISRVEALEDRIDRAGLGPRIIPTAWLVAAVRLCDSNARLMRVEKSVMDDRMFVMLAHFGKHLAPPSWR